MANLWSSIIEALISLLRTNPATAGVATVAAIAYPAIQAIGLATSKLLPSNTVAAKIGNAVAHFPALAPSDPTVLK